jgi:pantoate--beta-alanine ligase
MILFKKSVDMVLYLKQQQKKGSSVGWVPTMGALHEGHISLLDQARKGTNLTICSIFVNPTQFNVASDFEKYPVTIEKDILMLEENGVDVLFLPSVKEIYPKGTTQLEQYPLGYLETIFEGAFRPGHFQGVCQVMSRLSHMIGADHLYMGEKDYQQCMVIKKLLGIIQSPTALHTCTTRREADGLAMSSRNMRLTATERKNAVGIYKTLTELKTRFRRGNLDTLLGSAKETLSGYDFSIDYIAIADASTLIPISEWDGVQKAVVLAAAYQHEVRLIDNLQLN